MKNVRGFRASAAAAAALLAAGLLAVPAHADKLIFQDLEDDGGVTMLYESDDGHIWALFADKDGNYTVFDPSGDSNPDDTSTGKGSHADQPDVAELIKNGADIHVRIAPADSPELLAHMRGSFGGDNGPAPHWNPGDDDNGHGPGTPPDHSKDNGKTPEQIRAEIATANQLARNYANWRDSMGSGEEGGTETWGGPNKKGSPTGGNNDNKPNDKDDDQGSNDNPPDNDTLGDTLSLGPKPEVVNPPIVSRDGATGGGGAARNGGAHAAAGGGAAGGAHALR